MSAAARRQRRGRIGYAAASMRGGRVSGKVDRTCRDLRHVPSSGARCLIGGLADAVGGGRPALGGLGPVAISRRALQKRRDERLCE